MFSPGGRVRSPIGREKVSGCRFRFWSHGLERSLYVLLGTNSTPSCSGKTGRGEAVYVVPRTNSTPSCSGKTGCRGAVYVVPTTNSTSSVQVGKDAEGQFTSCPGQVPRPFVQVGKGCGSSVLRLAPDVASSGSCDESRGAVYRPAQDVAKSL